MFDENQVRQAINTMKPNGQLFEIRIIGSNMTYTGYFRDAEVMLQQLKKLNINGLNIYITLNEISEACYSRSQRDKFEKASKSTVTTSDNDIVRYNWLMIDLDPKRPTGTSSSDEQLMKAKLLQAKIYSFLKQQGFSDPLAATSGNGYHLLYKIDAESNQVTKKLIERSLKTLDMLFSDSDVTVDTANFNPARICKLYGTKAQKGADTPERPHRMSGITSKELDFKTTDVKCLEKLCEIYPKEEKPQRYNNYSPRDFDLRDWMSKYGINYTESGFSDGTKYILECCPFDSNHKGKDACIFQSRDGRIGFHCFHSSCSDKSWRDVRILFEPDAYEKRNEEYHKKIYEKQKEQPKSIESQNDKPAFYTAEDILKLPKVDEKFVRTGIKEIDRKLRGLKKGYVSVMSGMRAAGKSSIISEIVLECAQNGDNVCVYSGELTPKNFNQWLLRQAAGKGYVEPTDFEGYYTVRLNNQEKIAKWLGSHFWLYNNDYGNDYEAIIEQCKSKIQEKNLDLLILDNLMTMNLRILSDNKYEAQTQFVLRLQRLAKETMVHILFVAHPRKAMGFLRLDDISGTADLANAVDNAFIVHRVNADFKRLSKEMFGWKDDNDLFMATNVIEIAKDRDGGVQDYFIPLYYEIETKRLRNSETENKIYGWNTESKDEIAKKEEQAGFVSTEGKKIPF